MNRGPGVLRAGRQILGHKGPGQRRFSRGQTAARAQPPPSSGSSGAPAASSSSAGRSGFGWAAWALPPAAAALFSGMAHAYSSQQQLDLEAGHARAALSLKAAHSWIEQIESQPGTVKAMDAEMLLEENHPILEDVSARRGCEGWATWGDVTAARIRKLFHAPPCAYLAAPSLP